MTKLNDLILLKTIGVKIVPTIVISVPIISLLLGLDAFKDLLVRTK